MLKLYACINVMDYFLIFIKFNCQPADIKIIDSNQDGVDCCDL